MSVPLLEVHELEAQLGEFHFGPISFELPARAWLVLLGPSGCGKTTLLRFLAGVYRSPPTAIRLDGRPIGRLPPEQRQMAYVAQANDLFPHLTVQENIAFGLRFLPLSQTDRLARIRRFLDLFRLTHRAHYRAGLLSGGEGRRLALARALAIEPQLLLLDEPLGMLDPNSRRELHECLTLVHEELGTATIHVTHDREEAWTLNGLCGVLLHGRLGQLAPVEELFHHPANPEIARFLGAENVCPAREFGCPNDTLAMLRPEHLLLDSPNPQTGCLATILACRDRGAFHEVELSLGSNRRWIAHLGKPLPDYVVSGARVSVRWDPQHLHLFGQETAP